MENLQTKGFDMKINPAKAGKKVINGDNFLRSQKSIK